MSTYKIIIERDGEEIEFREIELGDDSGEITMDFEHREDYNAYVNPGARIIKVNVKFSE